MSQARWERTASATGAGFAVLVLASFLVAPSPPGRKATPEQFASFFLSAANRDRYLVSAGLTSVGVILLLWFLGVLRAHLRRAEGEVGRLSETAFGAGLVSAAMLGVTAGLSVLVPGDIGNYQHLIPDGNTLMLLQGLYTVLISVAGFPLAALIAATTVLGFRAGALPRWLAWSGIVATLAALGLFTYLPLLVVAAWFLATSLVLIGRTPTRTGAA